MALSWDRISQLYQRGQVNDTEAILRVLQMPQEHILAAVNVMPPQLRNGLLVFLRNYGPETRIMRGPAPSPAVVQSLRVAFSAQQVDQEDGGG